MDPQGYVTLEKNAPAKRPTSGEKILRLDVSTAELSLVSGDGTEKPVAAVTSYADQTAAELAEAANIVYYNEDTGLFQVTT